MSTDNRDTPPSRLHFGAVLGDAAQVIVWPPIPTVRVTPRDVIRDASGDYGCPNCWYAHMGRVRPQQGACATCGAELDWSAILTPPAGANAAGQASGAPWQPIASAPPERGSRVLVYDGCDMRVVTRIEDGLWELDEGGLCEPTLWLPVRLPCLYHEENWARSKCNCHRGMERNPNAR